MDESFDGEFDRTKEKFKIESTQLKMDRWISTSDKLANCFEQLKKYINDQHLPLLNDKYAFNIFYDVINPDRHLVGI